VEHGKVVEIYERFLGRQKCNCGRSCATAWVFVDIERESGTPVTDRSAEALLATIKACVLPGSTVVSDCWGYSILLHNEGLTHQAVDHSIGSAAHGCSYKYDLVHVEARHGSPQALLRKRS
jgi:hypothetical protein